MRYTKTIIFCLIVSIVNGSSLFIHHEPSPYRVFLFIVNIVIIFLIGRQLERYFFIKKELGTTKLSLIQYSYGLNSTMDGVGITNEHGEFEYVNESHMKMYGYSKKELLQSNWSICYSQSTIERLSSLAMPALDRDGYWRGEADGIRKDGTSFPQEIILSRIKNSKKVFCVVRDVTEQKIAEENIKHMALTNELTQLPNRRSLLLRLHQLMDEADRIFVLFLDLDRFKIANDTLGHEAGDRLLEQVANRLVSFRNEYTSVFHIGGDEFIMLIHNIDKHSVNQVASVIGQVIDKPFYVSGNEISITTSIGISCYPDDHVDIEELLKLADTAMYYAKLSGKNNHEFINNDIKLFLETKSFLELELKKAIRNQELVLHYQPKLALQRNKLVGVEALIRWKHPTLGTISPVEFIPIAEETGLIVDIGKWVIKEALQQISEWEKEGFPLQVSVNVSQRQLKREGELVQHIQACLQQYNVNPKDLELEITESVLENYEKIIPVLNEVKTLGIKVAIDDFGTGFSSLGSLKYLPINTLKIDQTFIKDLEGNKTDLAIVKSIIDVGRNLEIEIVAEGIETIEQLNILKDFKCLYGQGYYFGQPLPPEQFKEKFLT
jgi:diguanylate cyclase (GGDEF)-like protein/PAS domain S-box-containing protein